MHMQWNDISLKKKEKNLASYYSVDGSLEISEMVKKKKPYDLIYIRILQFFKPNHIEING